MRVLIDIGHPGHVHLFRPLAKELESSGHEFFFTCREKEFEIELLKAANLKFKSFGKKYKSIPGKIWGMIEFDLKEFAVARKFKPDLYLSHGSIYAAHSSFLTGKPHISLEDTGNMEQVRLYLPFTEVVLTSTAFHKELGAKQLRYPSYHELAYLHPNRFEPDLNILSSQTNRDPNKKDCLIRFISWNATHDVGQKGLSIEDKKSIIERLKADYNIFISSESELPEEFKKYKLRIEPQQIHDIMASIDLFIGEGATMASECAVLGTPAIYINSMTAGTIDDQQEYGLLKHFSNTESIVGKVDKAISEFFNADLKARHGKMLKDRIDLTSYLKWFILNFPVSKEELDNNKIDLKNFQ